MSLLTERLERQLRYARLREQYPTVPASRLFAYACGDAEGGSLQEFLCESHKWVYTGTAYGGDDESYHGEGRVYCAHCGKDGDT